MARAVLVGRWEPVAGYVPRGVRPASGTNTGMDLDAFLKLLLDADRLAVIGAIARSGRGVDDIVEVTGVDRRLVLETVAALRTAGVVTEGGDGIVRLDRTVLWELAGRLPQPAPPDAAVFHGMTDAEREILGRFFRGDQLVEIPTSRSKRLVVLERLALEFVPGERYPEKAVNELLGRFNPDVASLRRYLVDEGLLDRAEGVYWRSGGRVLV